MWPSSFPERLAAWKCLRMQCQDLPAHAALDRINSWWSQTPWQPYYLHWDDSDEGWAQWREQQRESHAAANGLPYSFVQYVRAVCV
jgi:hypothetical protein